MNAHNTAPTSAEIQEPISPEMAPYMVQFNGECMGGLIEHGSILHAVPGVEIRPLDLVSVLLSGFDGPWAKFVNSLSGEGFAGIVKVFLGVYEADGRQVFLFGQLNPPTIVPIPESSISALDKLDFVGECAGPDRDALAMLIPFAGIGLSASKEAA